MQNICKKSKSALKTKGSYQGSGQSGQREVCGDGDSFLTFRQSYFCQAYFRSFLGLFQYFLIPMTTKGQQMVIFNDEDYDDSSDDDDCPWLGSLAVV